MMKYLAINILFFFATIPMLSQENFTLLFEPEINVGYRVSENYIQSFNIENRNFIYKNSEFKYVVKHIEIGHLSDYAISERTKIGLGVQYRFQEHFNSSSENEFRLVQRVSWKSNLQKFSLKQTIKNEQRFYSSKTKYRFRYEVGLTIPISESSDYINTKAEILLEVSQSQKPEFEHRFTSVYGWELMPKTDFEIGAQYRLADFTQELGHELYLVMGFDIDL